MIIPPVELKKNLNASRPSLNSIPRQGGKTGSVPLDTKCVNMLCISTKERKYVNQSKRRRPPIEINLQIYRYRSESESVRSPSRKDEHTLYRLRACMRCTSSSNSNSTDLPHTHEEVTQMT